jgi:SHS2 domain-containing protein
VSYRWVEHTAELELEIEAPTKEAVFVDALHALAELLGEDSHGDRFSREISFSREIMVRGRECAVLLRDWLDELVFLAETEGIVPDEVGRIELSERGLAATVECHRGNPRHLVKGATYHRLVFEPCDRGFHASVVLDV